MDDELNEVFEKAKEELTHLYYRWIMFIQMFGNNNHRIDIINQTSSNILMELHWLILDNMALSLSKLTDKAVMHGYNNLSLPYLIKEIEKTDKKGIVSELNKILGNLNEVIEPFKAIRNKRIAHNDLNKALRNDDSPLPGISRTNVNNALKLTEEFLNIIERTFFNKITRYDLMILPQDNDGRSLLIRLQQSLAYEKLEDSGIINRGMWKEFGDIDAKDL